MSLEWEPEWVVTPELATTLIEKQWPELAPVSVTEFGAGWDNTVYLINDSFVFRFPRRNVAIPLIQVEITLLPWVAPQVPLPVPNPCVAGAPSAEYPCPFAGYSVLPGRTLTSLNLPDAERCALAKPLAEFLATLHSLPCEEARLQGAPEDKWRRLDIHRRRARTDGQLAVLVNAGHIQDRTPIDDLLHTLPVIDNPRADTVVHGDLHSNQILVNGDHQLSG